MLYTNHLKRLILVHLLKQQNNLLFKFQWQHTVCLKQLAYANYTMKVSILHNFPLQELSNIFTVILHRKLFFFACSHLGKLMQGLHLLALCTSHQHPNEVTFFSPHSLYLMTSIPPKMKLGYFCEPLYYQAEARPPCTDLLCTANVHNQL